MPRTVVAWSFAYAIVVVAVAPVHANEWDVDGVQTTSGFGAATSERATDGVATNSLCGKDVDLNDFCFESSICNVTLSCTTNADCDPGSRCLLDNCCGYNICSVQNGFCSGGGMCTYYQPCIFCQEAVDENQSSDVVEMAGFSQTDLAQSFQQRVPNIKSAEIFLRSGLGTQDSVMLSIYDGLPNAGGTMLIQGGTIARAGEWARVRFPPTSLDSGQTYYMVLESGGTGGLSVSGDTFNPYPLGQVFANPGFLPYPDFDYTFRTFAEVPIMLDGFETNGTSAWGNNPVNRICSVFFDDAWGMLGHGSDPDSYYGPFGVNFDNTNGYGVIGGEGNGNSGGWDVEGTYGSAAWGIWAGSHSISFASPVTMVSLDMLRGPSDYSITVDAYLGGGLVESQTVTLNGPHSSEPVSFAGPIDEIILNDSGVGGAGMDNLVYTGLTTCP